MDSELENPGKFGGFSMAVYVGNAVSRGNCFEELADLETSILDGVVVVKRAFINILSI